MEILNMDSGNNIEHKTEGTERKTAIFYISDDALCLAERLKWLYQHALVLKFKAETVSALWSEYKTLIFIMATGIVVRTIAPLIRSKKTDPAVVVLSQNGNFVISLLSGHEGGANDETRKISGFLGAQAVITTASEVKKGARGQGGKGSREDRGGEWAMGQGDRGRIKDFPLKPSNPLIIGIGCNRGTSAVEIEDAVGKTLGKNNLTISSVHSLATIDKKANEEGLIAFARKYDLEINTFTPDELNKVKGILKSAAVHKAAGANAVAEPAALLSSGADNLLILKQKIGNVTLAVAEQRAEYRIQKSEVRIQEIEDRRQKAETRGRILMVGTGPGGIEHITPYAQDVIRKADVIVGYDTYISLIAELIKDKDIFSTGMTQEVERCKKAIELASKGKSVAVISSGDPGIYAMAGLMLEMLKAQGMEQTEFKIPNSEFLSVEVIPGISALNACASRLGAPIMHDFACISLSDRLTSWKLIEKRLEASSMADFVIVLYNPRSKGRREHINRARDIILKYRLPETPVGIISAAMRADERITITDLENMLDNDIDMQTTIIIGNSQTFIWDRWMITPRGYRRKGEF
ncbi:MAG: precorrin-3B C(17)-methyltransferase [bacterium]|nr:precorrin-3B C(17)-methyltransferase [bacterium]